MNTKCLPCLVCACKHGKNSVYSFKSIQLYVRPCTRKFTLADFMLQYNKKKAL